jgi:IS30 family transposase
MNNYKRITYEDRVKIELLIQQQERPIKIASLIGHHPSSVKRELSRFPRSYTAIKAHAQALDKAGGRNGKRKLDWDKKLLRYIHEKLKLRWSPQQISKQLRADFKKDKRMRASHETIYTYIYLLPRGELKRELISYLRQGKKSRYRKRNKATERRGKLPNIISIEERPALVAKRSVAGHWEGDLIVGKGHKSALGTIVERKTRALIMVPLKAKDALSVRSAFEKELLGLPKQMRKSLTYDNGHEMAEHVLFTSNTKMKVYFAHPNSPWERGTCENTNGLIRQFFPKGTDFNKVGRREIKKVQKMLNERPRAVLGYKTPKDVFEKEILKACG